MRYFLVFFFSIKHFSANFYFFDFKKMNLNQNIKSKLINPKVCIFVDFKLSNGDKISSQF